MNEMVLIDDLNTELTIFDELTQEEEQTLAQLEGTVDQSFVAGFSAGKALADILQKGLYRHYSTDWKVYLQTRWGMSKSSAHRLISAHAVADFLILNEQPGPGSVNQANALYMYRSPDQRILDLWRVAREKVDGTPTEFQIKTIGRQLYPDQKVQKDDGIPDNLESLKKENLVLKMSKQLLTIANRLENCGPRILPWLKYHAQMVEMIRTAGEELAPFQFHAVCPVCNSDEPDCRTCQGTGWLPQHKFEELQNV